MEKGCEFDFFSGVNFPSPILTRMLIFASTRDEVKNDQEQEQQSLHECRENHEYIH